MPYLHCNPEKAHVVGNRAEIHLGPLGSNQCSHSFVDQEVEGSTAAAASFSPLPILLIIPPVTMVMNQIIAVCPVWVRKINIIERTSFLGHVLFGTALWASKLKVSLVLVWWSNANSG